MSNLFAEFKQAAILNTLRRCQLFMNQAGLDLNAVASMTVIKPVAKGDFVFCEGAPVHAFFIVQSGAIKVYRVNQAGREQVLHVYRTHESFAEETLLSDTGYMAYARAAEDSRVLVVQKTGFLSLLRRQPELAFCLLRTMGQHLCGLVGLVDDLTLKDVKTRLAGWLVQRCPNPSSNVPCDIELPMTKNMLASELGTGSETLSRTLATFRQEKLLSVAGRTITLLCPSKLARLSGYHFPELPVRTPHTFRRNYEEDLDESNGRFIPEQRRKTLPSRTSRYAPVLAA